MLFRAFVLSVVLAGLAGLSFAQFPTMGPDGPNNRAYSNGQTGAMGQGTWNGSMHNTNSIIGAVHTADNQPVNNARVELHDSNTGATLSSSYTGVSGSFEFRQLPQGSYELVAYSSTAQTAERVQVNSMNTNVDLRLPINKAPDDGIAGRTVSVNQYRVPESAREELRKAHEAAAKDKKDEEVMKHLDRAVGIYPAYADALSMRAAVKLDNHDVPGAMEDAQKAIDSDGNYALAYTVMGSALNIQQKFDEALRSLQRAETLSPDVWQTYFEIGRAYAGKKDFAASLRALDRAQKLAPPNYSLIQLVRAYSLMGLGRNSEAAVELQAYVAKNPNSPRIEQAKKMLAQAQEAAERARN